MKRILAVAAMAAALITADVAAAAAAVPQPFRSNTNPAQH